MGGHGKSRWKLSSFYHRSPSSTPACTATPSPSVSASEAPREFLCPISGRLMADPVILSSGQTFERACVLACKDLGVVPPGAGEGGSPSADLFFIPNIALKTAICNWCDAAGVDRPKPVDLAAALHLVSGLLLPSPSNSSAAPSPASSSASIRVLGEAETETKVEGAGKASSDSAPEIYSSSASVGSYFTGTTTLGSTFTSTSSSSSSEILSGDPSSPPKSGLGTAATSPLEEEILSKLRDSQVPEQEAGLLLLRSATRDGSGDNRSILCTHRILAALRPILLSRFLSLQSNAAASVVNLSLQPSNRVRIVRSGVVPAIVDALKAGPPEAQDHAAGALFSLSMEDENRAAIGALGAFPPLLHILAGSQADERTRRDAAMALYYLSLSSTNRLKLVKLGAVKTLLGILAAPPREAPTLLNPALMVLSNLASCSDGRAAMIDSGATEAVVRLLKEATGPSAVAKKESCVAVLYGMSRGGMRYRGLARIAGAEEALRTVVEQEEAAAEAASTAAERERRWRVKEMALRILLAMDGKGNDDGDSFSAVDGGLRGGLRGTASEPAIRSRGCPVNANFANSTRF